MLCYFAEIAIPNVSDYGFFKSVYLWYILLAWNISLRKDYKYFYVNMRLQNTSLYYDTNYLLQSCLGYIAKA